VRNRFKNRGLGAIDADERGGAEVGSADRVGCFYVVIFCDGAGCRSADSNSCISSEATSDGEASACLRAFCSTESGCWGGSTMLASSTLSPFKMLSSNLREEDAQEHEHITLMLLNVPVNHSHPRPHP